MRKTALGLAAAMLLANSSTAFAQEGALRPGGAANVREAQALGLGTAGTVVAVVVVVVVVVAIATSGSDSTTST
jgi:hypothetical protein